MSSAIIRNWDRLLLIALGSMQACCWFWLFSRIRFLVGLILAEVKKDYPSLESSLYGIHFATHWIVTHPSVMFWASLSTVLVAAGAEDRTRRWVGGLLALFVISMIVWGAIVVELSLQ